MLRFGVDYYPEQWPQDRWETDARLMAEAGFNVVRLAEFAWSKLEPKEGRFEFEWLDRAIAVLQQYNLSVVLGTPTASMPAWLVSQSPEILRVRQDGLRAGYGSRRENCPNHPLFRRAACRVTTAMAEHYASSPAVIGWQIDNEVGDRCYCPICHKEFQKWLERRYHTLDELNQHWGTVFWSHSYSAWEQIPLPLDTIGSAKNPAHELDFKRFTSDSYVSFLQEQAGILRSHCAGHFITHDMMGFDYEGLDYFDLAESLDLVSWNNYPIGFWHRQPYQAFMPALSHDSMRGLKRKNFWVMEQQAGPTGWDTVSPTPRPGVLRLWAYQSIAHGADGVVFFRWRTARYGAEQLWHGLLEHDGRTSRRYEEIKKMGAELVRIGEKIGGAEYPAGVALIHDYDTRFAFQLQPIHANFNYEKHVAQIYAALWKQGINIDLLPPCADLSSYRLVIAPALHLLGEDGATNLSSYVRSGGTLVVTARSGVKDADNALVDLPFPGWLAETCGLFVEEYDALQSDRSQAVRFEYGDLRGEVLPVDTWCDILKPAGAEVMARFTREYYAGKPAVTRNKFGAGQAFYLGAFGPQPSYDVIFSWLVKQVNIPCPLQASAGIEITERRQGDAVIHFVLNFNQEPGWVSLPGTRQNLLDGTLVSGKIPIGANDVLILSA